MKAIKGSLDNIGQDFRRNLNAVNPHLGNPNLTKIVSAEKAVWNNLSTWSVEQHETSKALASWGKSEGTDLSDVAEKLSILTTKMADAEGILADKYAQYRGHLKDIRTRESSLKDQRFKRESLWAKIEKEERKASHSKKPETSEQKLTEYHKEMEKLEQESMAEEAALADYKREKLRIALSVQMDAFYEFGAKLMILSDYGKEITEQIHVAHTEPGEPRVYNGQETTAQAVAKAIAALDAWVPPPHHRPPYPLRPRPASPPLPNEASSDSKMTTTYLEPTIFSKANPFDDPNEADHSDLDLTDFTDMEGELAQPHAESVSKFTEVIYPPPHSLARPEMKFSKPPNRPHLVEKKTLELPLVITDITPSNPNTVPPQETTSVIEPDKLPNQPHIIEQDLPLVITDAMPSKVPPQEITSAIEPPNQPHIIEQDLPLVITDAMPSKVSPQETTSTIEPPIQPHIVEQKNILVIADVTSSNLNTVAPQETTTTSAIELQTKKEGKHVQFSDVEDEIP